MYFFSKQTLYVILVPGCLHVSKAQQLLRILVATKIRCNSGANHSYLKIRKKILQFLGEFFALIFIQIYDTKNFLDFLFWIMHPTTYLVGCFIQKRLQFFPSNLNSLCVKMTFNFVFETAFLKVQVHVTIAFSI